MTSGNSVNRGVRGKLGFNRDEEWTDLDPCPFSLGTVVTCSNGDRYRLVRATAAKTKGYTYMADEAFLVGLPTTNALSDAIPGVVGIAHRTTTAPTSLNASATYTYFWLQIAGTFDYALTASAVATNALAYTTDNGGCLDDGSNSGNIIQALRFVTYTTASSYTSVFSACDLHVSST